MDEISVIGVDLAKRWFALSAMDTSGRIVWRKRLSRGQFMGFMGHKARRCLVGLEACGSAHYWGRWLVGLGFEVKLIAPRAAKAYLWGPHKNDHRDADAIAEATSRPQVRAVALKGVEACALQARLRVRERQQHQLVQCQNQFRALLSEFGFVAAKGFAALSKAYCERIRPSQAFAALPADFQTTLDALLQECEALAAKLAASRRGLQEATARDHDCRRLMTIPAIGPINAAGLCAGVVDANSFASGRAFAAWLGLVPRQSASAARNRLGPITKHGSKHLRCNLVLAAQSLITQAKRAEAAGRPLDRLQRLALRLCATSSHRNIAACAVANRLARICWAVLARGCVYQGQPTHQGAKDSQAAPA